MNLVQNMQAASEVARLGSFSAAARWLNLSAPSVSRLVAELEDDLGVNLFVRTTRHVALTPEGAIFVRKSAAILEDIETLRAELAASETAPKGTVRLTSVVAFGNELLSGALAKFSMKYPDITVKLDISNRRVDLIEENVDVAIRIGGADGLDDSSMIARRLYQQTLIFVATPEFVARHGLPQTLAELETLPLVRFATGTFGRTHRLVGPNNDETAFALPGSFVVNSPIAARNATLAGGHIGLVAEYLVRNSLDEGRLVRVLDDWSTRPQPIYAIYARRDLMPARQRLLLDFLAEAFVDRDAPRA